MAKWGEGDPRWVVQDRGDGHNVNGWHWTEKNFTAWTRKRIEELVKDLSANMNAREGWAKVTSLKSMDGEVVVNIRKGNKLFVIYDISVTLAWKGEALRPLSSEKQKVSGEIKLAEFANDNDVDDYMFEVSVEGDSESHTRLKKAMVSTRDLILEKLHQVLRELHESVR